ncbi:hypothetical protein Taro_004154 [Colocasia esculenta]|uniref:Uncharacterized protein n=1 Tax=Colocasia esculenta TaxID=4460 RepID=A0A843TLD0_COLES|nr:hypothetical protein [Colocasia esculenta]
MKVGLRPPHEGRPPLTAAPLHLHHRAAAPAAAHADDQPHPKGMHGVSLELQASAKTTTQAEALHRRPLHHPASNMASDSMKKACYLPLARMPLPRRIEESTVLTPLPCRSSSPPLYVYMLPVFFLQNCSVPSCCMRH